MDTLKISPDSITSLQTNEIFVFGSNYAGKHGRGAANTAYRKFGAKWGHGAGIQGSSYGIPTKDKWLKVLSLSTIETHIIKFIKFAYSRPNLKFLVTKVGCGLAGYKVKDIAPLFFNCSLFHEVDNIYLPKEFYDYKR